jgi:hypothetical protein
LVPIAEVCDLVLVPDTGLTGKLEFHLKQN